MNKAVFLDRDGTLIRDPGYIRDPDHVELLPGVGQAVARVNRAGFLAIVVTNQSGIARGLVTEQGYFAVEARVDALLASEGARIDAHYFCPHLPEVTGPCECRKPGTLLYTTAAARFGIDLAGSWWVGDRLRDVEPALKLGGRGVLLTHPGEPATLPDSNRLTAASDLPEAVDRYILSR